VGAFREKENADRHADELKEKGYPVIVKGSEILLIKRSTKGGSMWAVPFALVEKRLQATRKDMEEN
jgi:ADP-ribose pyrophosphatase YjhB (NUDIX family)